MARATSSRKVICGPPYGAPMPSAPAIEVRELTKQYGNGVRALQGISFEIRPGDVVGYLGPNGAGKTTTMKILTNLIRPTSGEAYIMGAEVRAHPKRALHHIGALIEVPGVYEYLTPNEVLGYFGRVHGLPAAETVRRSKEVLDEVRLTEWARAKLGGFSTGMTRRFFLALAMLHDPDVLILDEPVLGLDPRGMQDIRLIIKALAKQGKTVLLSSHLLGEVAETCNRIIMIHEGRIRFVDTVENTVRRTSSRRIAVEFLSTPSEEHLRTLRALPGVRSIELNGTLGVLEYEGERPAAADILRGAVAVGVPLLGFSPQQGSLEDLYISIVGKEGGIR